MATDAAMVDTAGTNSSKEPLASATSTTPIVANRLFLSHIDYTNHDNNGKEDLSPEEVKEQLEVIFSKYGNVLEIYLSEREDPTKIQPGRAPRPPFGFVAMETVEEARTALEALGGPQYRTFETTTDSNDRPRLFRELAPAKVHASKKNPQNKNERLRSERLKAFRRCWEGVERSNALCQVHTSHIDRLRDFCATSLPGTTVVDAIAAPKGTSFLLLHIDDDDNESSSSPSDDGAEPIDGTQDRLETVARTLWNTWFVAPNLNRVTVWNPSDNHRVQGNLRKAVVPAIFRSLSALTEGTTDRVAVSLRVAIFPPKLQRSLLQGLEEHNDTRDENLDLRLVPGNPTHTISIVQLHPGVVSTPGAKGDHDKALYLIGRLEPVAPTRKRASSGEDGSGSSHAVDDKYRFQQQSTSQIPQPLTSPMVAHNSNLKAIGGSKLTPENGNAAGSNNSEDDKSISRAHWKLQEAWERYKHQPPSLVTTNPDDKDYREPLWALDCGAAPGGWTKFLFRPGIVDRIYAVDPGKLSPEVVPGLDEAHPGTVPVVHYKATTIQKALPGIAADLETASKDGRRRNPVLDVWVSDMCVKDMAGQIDCFLKARSEGVVGKGTFFVLTLKCLVGYSATSFDYQATEQVERLQGISRDVHVVHLFSNRSSERTIIGYLI